MMCDPPRHQPVTPDEAVRATHSQPADVVN